MTRLPSLRRGDCGAMAAAALLSFLPRPSVTKYSACRSTCPLIPPLQAEGGKSLPRPTAVTAALRAGVPRQLPMRLEWVEAYPSQWSATEVRGHPSLASISVGRETPDARFGLPPLPCRAGTFTLKNAVVPIVCSVRCLTGMLLWVLFDNGSGRTREQVKRSFSAVA